MTKCALESSPLRTLQSAFLRQLLLQGDRHLHCRTLAGGTEYPSNGSIHGAAAQCAGSGAVTCSPVWVCLQTQCSGSHHRACSGQDVRLGELVSAADSCADLGSYFPPPSILCSSHQLTVLILVRYKRGQYAKGIKFIPVNPTILYWDTAKKRD